MKAFIGIIIAIVFVPFLLSTFYSDKQNVNYVSAADDPTPTCDPKSCDPDYDCLYNRKCNTSNIQTCDCLPKPSSVKKQTYCDYRDYAKKCPGPTLACVAPVIDNYFSVSFGKISPDVDILFAFDTTGSMGHVITTAKSVGKQLLNSLDEQLGNRAQFGIIDFRDYNVPPYGTSIDYPYKLVVPLTKDKEKAMTGIDSLTLGHGADGPESYLRVMKEAASSIEWRDNTKKVLVFFGDSIEHDPDYDGMTMEKAIDEFKTKGISLLYVDIACRSYIHWNKVAEAIGIGSTAACVRSSGEEFVSQILELIIGVVRKVKELSLKVWPDGYVPWVIYEKVDGLRIPAVGMEFRFPYTIKPIGVSKSMKHSIGLDLMADKVVLLSTTLAVEIRCDGSYPTPTATPTVLPTFTPTPILPTSTPSPPMCDVCGILNKISDIGTHGGDYNCDNSLNIADYSIWRKEFVDKVVPEGEYIMSDGNCNNVSDGEDYSVWRNNFIK